MSSPAAFKGFGTLKSQSRNDSLRLDEVLDIMKWIDKKWVEIRILPLAPLQVKQAWIKIYGGKEKKEITIPRYVVNFDPNNPDKPKKGVKCPYSDYFFNKQEDKKNGPIRLSDFWLFNVIDREKQEEGAPRKSGKPTKEEKKTGHKDIGSDTWTPVRVARFTMTMINRLAELSEDNIKKDKKTGKKSQYDASDAKHGFDVKIKYKKDAPGTDKYSIDKVDGGATPLTDKEKEYLVWKLDESLLDATGRMTEEQAKEDFKRMELVGGEGVDDDDDDDDDNDRKKSKSKKSRDLDDDEDDKPKKGKKKKPFDDDEDDDEDEDDKKSKKSKSKEKVKSKDKGDKKKSKKSDDDDEDEPKKSKKKKKSSDDDDDEPKKSKKSDKGGAKKKDKSDKDGKKSGKKGKKKSSWDDD